MWIYLPAQGELGIHIPHASRLPVGIVFGFSLSVPPVVCEQILSFYSTEQVYLFNLTDSSRYRYHGHFTHRQDWYWVLKDRLRYKNVMYVSV